MTMNAKMFFSRGMCVAVLAAGTTALGAGSLFAQTGSTPPPPPPPPGQMSMGPGGMAEMHQHSMDRMAAKLNLSADQVTQVKAIREDGMKQMMALHEAEKAKIRGVLTDEQKVKFDAMMDKKMEHRGGHHGMGRMPPPPPPPAQ